MKQLDALAGLSLAVLVASLGCGDSSKPAEVQPEPVEPASAEVASTTTTGEVAASTSSTSSTSSTTMGAAVAEPVDELGPWTVAFAYDVGTAELAELRTALQGAGMLDEHEALLVTAQMDSGDLTWLAAGLHASEDEAKAAARKLGKALARKAVAWELRSHCERSDTGLACEPISLAFPLELWPLELRTDVPEPGPVPPPITLAKASTVVVVGSNLAFEPGKTSIDSSPKFRTWIWQPARGELPKQGNVSGAAPAEGDPSSAPLVEERDGAWVAADARLHRLVSEGEKQPLSRCDCDASLGDLEDVRFDDDGFDDDGAAEEEEFDGFDDRFKPGSGKVEEKLGTTMPLEFPNLYVEVDGERELLLPFGIPSRAQCANARADMRVDFQLVAVAGSLVFVAHRERVEVCEGIVSDLSMTLRVFDLASGSELELGELEQELDPTATGTARTQAALAISELFSDDYVGERDALWPEALELTAMFPRYREWKGGMEMIMQYGVECTACYEQAEFGARELDAIDWDSQYWVARRDIDYPASSRLAPPPEALALFEYVHRVHGNWKTFGWSMIPSDAAPAASPSEPSSPTPSEPPVQPPPSP